MGPFGDGELARSVLGGGQAHHQTVEFGRELTWQLSRLPGSTGLAAKSSMSVSSVFGVGVAVDFGLLDAAEVLDHRGTQAGTSAASARRAQGIAEVGRAGGQVPVA
jgi:hypothetical protein